MENPKGFLYLFAVPLAKEDMEEAVRALPPESPCRKRLEEYLGHLKAQGK